MSGVFFAYTIVVMLVCAFAAIMSLAAFFVSRRRTLLARVGFFLFYLLDLVGIFGSEWAVQNLAQDPSSYYDIDSPMTKIVLSAGVLLCYWFMVTHVLDEHSRKVRLVPVVTYAVAAALVVAAMPFGALRQWSYYTLRQVFLAFTQVYAWWRYRKSKSDEYRARLGRYRTTWLVMWVLIACILVEDTLIILVLPIPSAETQWALLFLSSRNVSENVTVCYLAYVCTRSALRQLNLRSEEAPAARPGGASAEDLATHIAEQLPAYASTNKLSPREREVLTLVLEGKDNRTIANELFLSEGTIKTHVHNIMKKTKTGSRDELKKDFWSQQ